VELSRIIRHLGADVSPGYEDVDISGISDPQSADERSITFVASPKYLSLVRESMACAVIVKKGDIVAGKISLEVDDPYLGFALAAQLFEDRAALFDGPVHPTAVIHNSATIQQHVFIGPYSVIGKGCRIDKGTIMGAHCIIENGTVIGEDCRIDSGAIIRRNCIVGNRVIIQSGAVIGGEGFGNARDKYGHWVRIPSFGTVIIEDEAEIGANTTIDRGTLGPTVIGRRAKIDNLVMIAHNDRIGDDTAIAAQAGISGSTSIGQRVIIGGQAGFAGHIDIGDDAFIGAQAGVGKNIAEGEKVTGSPSRNLMTMRRAEASQMQLPELLKEVKRLRADLNRLKARFNPPGENIPEL
jgi:UDP-3-O-[3-hydroxymyristoyl] glucosamine N-acyltransferase